MCANTSSFKALSVVAPTGELIREGSKTLEIRRWKPEVILPLTDLLIVENSVRLSSTGCRVDPDGRAVALVDVVAVRPWCEADLAASCSVNFEENWFAWELENVRRVDYSRAVEACLRIYSVEVCSHELVGQKG